MGFDSTQVDHEFFQHDAGVNHSDLQRDPRVWPHSRQCGVINGHASVSTLQLSGLGPTIFSSLRVKHAHSGRPPLPGKPSGTLNPRCPACPKEARLVNQRAILTRECESSEPGNTSCVWRSAVGLLDYSDPKAGRKIRDKLDAICSELRNQRREKEGLVCRAGCMALRGSQQIWLVEAGLLLSNCRALFDGLGALGDWRSWCSW